MRREMLQGIDRAQLSPSNSLNLDLLATRSNVHASPAFPGELLP